MSEKEKKGFYFLSTKNEIEREYEALISAVKTVLEQPAAIVKKRPLRKIVVIIDESLVTSKKFTEFIYRFGSKAERIIGIYIPEEEEIIERLKDLGEDKREILRELKKYERDRTVKMLDSMGRLESELDISIDIEVLHKPRVESIVRLTEEVKPDLIVMFRDYLKDRDADISHIVMNLLSKLNYPVLLIS